MDIPSTPDPFEMYGNEFANMDAEEPVEQAYIPHIAVRPVILALAGDFNTFHHVQKPKHVSLVDALGLGRARSNTAGLSSHALPKSAVFDINSAADSRAVPRGPAVDVSVQCDTRMQS